MLKKPFLNSLFLTSLLACELYASREESPLLTQTQISAQTENDNLSITQAPTEKNDSLKEPISPKSNNALDEKVPLTKDKDSDASTLKDQNGNSNDKIPLKEGSGSNGSMPEDRNNDSEQAPSASTNASAWKENQPLDQPKTHCGYRPQPIRLGLRHIEGNGVGYNQGYTTLEGFFAPAEPWGTSWVPFLDLRGHAFNGGRLAANAGIGVRHLMKSRIWGINAWYDYRRTSAQHYNQASIGLESLGKIWDFRINGYLPVGRKTSSLFNTKFNSFKNHYMILSSKREFAMKGLNAEVGAHVDTIKNFPLYFAAGPYYFEGKGENAWGGEARIALDIFDYIRLEGNTSYDNVFKWIGQGQISLMIPLGGRKKIREGGRRSGSQELSLATRSLQRVDRSEIIPVDRQHKKTKAIDPTTNEPYVFWFVDNTSHSQGTYESPFHTLSVAQDASNQNDVIYVFPGDGTTTGMNLGITLKDNQRFFGASVTHMLPTTLGTVQIPSLASQMPSIDQTFGLAATITVQNNNEVSGLSIYNTAGTNEIKQSSLLSSITNLSITQNELHLSSGNGINLSNALGEITISNNIINSAESAIILNSADNQNVNFAISNNSFNESFGGSDVIAITLSSCANPSLSIANNQILASGDSSVSLDLSSCTNGRLSIENNTLANENVNGISISLSNCNNNALFIKANDIQNSGTNGINVDLTNSSAGQKNTLTIQGNTIYADLTVIDISLAQYATADIELKNNTAVSSSSTGVSLNLNDHSSGNLTLTDNNITSPSDDPLKLTLNNNSQATMSIDRNTLTSFASNEFLLNNAADLSGSFKNNKMINHASSEDCIFLHTDSNTPSVSLSISSNTFTGGGNGFEASLNSSARANFSFINNQFNSPADEGIFIGTHGASTSSWVISGNTFTGSGIHALDYESAGTSTGCLKITSNTASPSSNAYIIHNGSSGTLSIEPLDANIGDVVTSGTITNIPAGGCSE